jgi:hypothetical protein
MSDKQLRASWLSLHGEPLSGCAPPLEIWEAVQGHGNEADVRALLEHSVACADCATLWRLARELTTAPGEVSTPFPLWSHLWRPRWVASGVALAAVAAVFAFSFAPRLARRDATVVRGSESEALSPAGKVVLERAHPVLRWTGAPDGSRYAVTVSTSDLTILFRATDLLNPELELPSGVVAAVPAGGTVVWRVEATLVDGRRLRSKAFLSRLE